MTPGRPGRRSLPLRGAPARPAALLAAVTAAAVGTALRDLGTGLLLAAAVLVLAGPDDQARAGRPDWPGLATEPGAQVGHPHVTTMIADLQRGGRGG